MHTAEHARCGKSPWGGGTPDLLDVKLGATQPLAWLAQQAVLVFLAHKLLVLASHAWRLRTMNPRW
eukprot:CAMPEP_0181200972 /NCGR_PEP_ID=MMETSP1096-20121128/18059_1 /TAXON_ID=156174 ORGANISM="Chrysochromulina ericina, Strain CCMP281" /NCGR_SAMPLE_ID=MMETSP1096 /ASSEMBLY_ACC=CAM_ASM_000453 /LENGTH=65 /DNA_ID=CAMNT_0023291385 /DNA_START=128 /DNA_END=325 /DNA_ORIENTATION=+